MLIATCLLPAEAVALERTLSADPDVHVEAERIAAHSTHWTMPCLWASGTDLETIESLLDDDPTIDEIVDGERFGQECHYHVEWTEAVQSRIDTYVDMEATILRASADVRGWELQLRFAAREQFDAFREHLDEQGNSFQLLHLTEPGAPRQDDGPLTPQQRLVLEAAAEEGYFDVPREITTRELADKLDRTHQSLSEILRRGTNNLVTAGLSTNTGMRRERPRDQRPS